VFCWRTDSAILGAAISWCAKQVLAVFGDDAAVIGVVNGGLKVLAVFGDDAL